MSLQWCGRLKADWRSLWYQFAASTTTRLSKRNKHSQFGVLSLTHTWAGSISAYVCVSVSGRCLAVVLVSTALKDKKKGGSDSDIRMTESIRWKHLSACSQDVYMFCFSQTLRPMSVVCGLQQELDALAEGKWKGVAGLLVCVIFACWVKAECCFAGISVQLSHVHLGPAFHRLLVWAVRHERKEDRKYKGQRKVSETSKGEDRGNNERHIKRRLWEVKRVR